MACRSMWFGHEIEEIDGEWVFSNTNKPTIGSDPLCGYCHEHQTIEGHDACLGTLPGVKNACCGHGQIADAYVQMLDGGWEQGRTAIKLIISLHEEQGEEKEIKEILGRYREKA